MTEYQLVDSKDTVYRDGTIKLHTEEGFEGMRKAGRLAATILDECAEWVQPGVSTESIDTKIRAMMLDAGAVPATLGYRGYTHSSCISINHVICHGIPSDKVLKEGDILNIDVTPLLDGWHGDTSRMFYAGEPAIKAKRLVDVTYECLMLGIEAASKPGARLGDIGAAIEAHARQLSIWRGARVLRARIGPPVPRRARSRPRGEGRDGPGTQARHVLHDRADDQSRKALGQGAR